MKITHKTDYAKLIRKPTVLTIVALMLAAMIIPAAMAAEISTAKLYYYYPEDQTVDIVGSDFLGNTNITITINIVESNIQFTDTITSNPDGSFVYTYPLTGLLYTYVVTATDGTNTATTTFYDPPVHNVNFATSGLPSGVSITVSWSKTNPAGKTG